jgi:hypothetical protein
MHDIETIDSELRLLLAIRHMVREAEGRTPDTARIDALLDERSATMVLNTTVAPALARCLGNHYMETPRHTQRRTPAPRPGHVVGGGARLSRGPGWVHLLLAVMRSPATKSGSMARTVSA